MRKSIAMQIQFSYHERIVMQQTQNFSYHSFIMGLMLLSTSISWAGQETRPFDDLRRMAALIERCVRETGVSSDTLLSSNTGLSYRRCVVGEDKASQLRAESMGADDLSPEQHAFYMVSLDNPQATILEFNRQAKENLIKARFLKPTTSQDASALLQHKLDEIAQMNRPVSTRRIKRINT
jgi:phage FluMu protein gp41